MSGGWTAKKEENGLPPSEDSPAASAPQMRTARRCVRLTARINHRFCLTNEDSEAASRASRLGFPNISSTDSGPGQTTVN
ncbi:rCG33425, isoform CRA_b [Rattus norvegicus]|uniref:RCG33425, isoform CRA_b n=1 Tax=Rattus norvegicus TaxID=10116 RepID=A6HEE8_RAT|nr:rCG33425, isoform CRA_b [Rattus norvegicus]